MKVLQTLNSREDQYKLTLSADLQFLQACFIKDIKIMEVHNKSHLLKSLFCFAFLFHGFGQGLRNGCNERESIIDHKAFVSVCLCVRVHLCLCVRGFGG